MRAYEPHALMSWKVSCAAVKREVAALFPSSTPTYKVDDTGSTSLQFTLELERRLWGIAAPTCMSYDIVDR
jgi:hypothetical protein